MTKDYIGSKIGMWLFLCTELILFCGLFLIYSVYRLKFSSDFHECAKTLDLTMGSANTIILITSSLFMALSILYIQKKDKNLSILFLIFTIILGFLFLFNKYFEWESKITHGIYPNSSALLKKSHGEILFYGLYYAMTGLHGLHIIAGIFILFFMLIFVMKEKINKADFIKLENSGLYWHFVDIIWIFLFPLFYLIT
jgi:cytochrome c oxidase subunit 3